jgi:hypothetical protein
VIAPPRRDRAQLLEQNDPFARPKRLQVRADPPRTATTARPNPSVDPRDETPLDVPQPGEKPRGATGVRLHRRATSARRLVATPARPRGPRGRLAPAIRRGDRATTTPALAPIERVQRRARDAPVLVLVLGPATRHGALETTTLALRARIERVPKQARADPVLARRPIDHRGTQEIASPRR